MDALQMDLEGEEQLRQDIVRCHNTWTPNGRFASAVVVDSRFARPGPAAGPSWLAAALMCAGIAVYLPLRR